MRADIKVGFSCNNRCRFCVQGDKRNYFPNRTTTGLRHFLRRARRVADSVVLTGGEPLIRKDILPVVRVARQLGFRTIQVQTNGRMLAYHRLCKELVEAGVSEFSPAIHGHTAGLHDFHTRSPGSFEQSVSGVKNLKLLGQKVITNTVVTRSSYRHLPDIAAFLVSLGVDQFQLAFVHPVGEAARNFFSVVPRMSLIEEYLHQGLEVGIRAGVRVMTEAIPYCFLRGYERCAAERIIPETSIWDAEGVIRDFGKYREEEAKQKAVQCAECSFNQICEGPWREYPEEYGFEEFVPRKEPWKKFLT